MKKNRMYQKGRNQHKMPVPKLVQNEVEDYTEHTSVDQFVRMFFLIIIFFIGVFGIMELF